MNQLPSPRIRSFVRRDGRLTAGQARALERLWPKYGLAFSPEPIDPEAIFGRRAPLTLEIGSGNGAALVTSATNRPEHDFIGVEVYRPGLGHLLRKAEAADLSNVRVINHDAVEVLETMLRSASLDQVLIYFPDPWPKKRHHKRRLIRPDFIPLLARVLKPGGRLELATDWEDYAENMLALIGSAPQFTNLAASGGYAERPPYRPLTRFERRGISRGHNVCDLLFKRR
jgi:tRNA (guanine-N7-)-methyltransferase